MSENKIYGIKLQLPSRGKYGKSFVNVCRPKAGDLLEYLQADNSITAKNMFVQGLCDTDLSKYPIGDREFIFANLRAMVNSTTITGVLPCTNDNCGCSVIYGLDLRTVKVNQLPQDFEADFEVTLPYSKETRVFNMLTLEKEELVDNYLLYCNSAEGEMVNMDLGDNLPEFAKYATMTTQVQTVQELDVEITKLRELDWSDLECMIMYDVMFECGPVIRTSAVCECGQHYNIKVKTDSTFFGLSLEGLINKHRFLSRNSGVSFKDFCDYTIPMMDNVTEGEVLRIQDYNSKIKK